MTDRRVGPGAQGRDASANNGRPGSFPGATGTSPRQRDLSQNRPPSAMGNSQRMPNSTMGNNAPQRPGTNSRTWEAQGSATDRGRTPTGFGGSNRPANQLPRSERMPRQDRPAWAGRSDSSVNSAGPRNVPPQNNNGNRPTYSNGGRSYEPPQRSNREMPVYRDNNRGASQP